eukprot:scaffold253907_cov17-Tisochrysis_lutea.AAC.2
MTPGPAAKNADCDLDADFACNWACAGQNHALHLSWAYADNARAADLQSVECLFICACIDGSTHSNTPNPTSKEPPLCLPQPFPQLASAHEHH